MTTIHQNIATNYSKRTYDAAPASKRAEDPNAQAIAEAQKNEIKAWLEANYSQYLAMKNGQVPATPEELAQTEAYINWALQKLGETPDGLAVDGHTPAYAPVSSFPIEYNGFPKGGSNNYVANQPENKIGLKFPDESNQYDTYAWGNVDLYCAYVDAQIVYKKDAIDPITGQKCTLITITSPSTGQSKQVYVMDENSKVKIHAVNAKTSVVNGGQAESLRRAVNEAMPQINIPDINLGGLNNMSLPGRPNVGNNKPANRAAAEPTEIVDGQITIVEYSVDEVAEQISVSNNKPDRTEGDVPVYDSTPVNYDVADGISETIYVYSGVVNVNNIPGSANCEARNSKIPGTEREAVKLTITMPDGTVKTIYIAKKPGQVINLPATADQITIDGKVIDKNSVKNLEKWSNQSAALSFNYIGKQASANGASGSNVEEAHLRNSTQDDTQPISSRSVLNGGETLEMLTYNNQMRISIHANSTSKYRFHQITNATISVDIYAENTDDVIELCKYSGGFTVTVYKHGDRTNREMFNIEGNVPPTIHHPNPDALHITYIDEQSETFFKSLEMTH